MNKLRIVFMGPVDLTLLDLVDPPPTHSFPFTAELVLRWIAKGHQVTALVLSEHVAVPTHLGGDRLHVIAVPMRPLRRRVADIYALERRALREVLRAQVYDAISAHWTYEYALAAIAVDDQSHVTIHDAPLRYAWEMRDPYRWVKNAMAFPVARRATRLSAVSPYVREHFSKVLRPQAAIRLIPNGVDPIRYSFRPRDPGEEYNLVTVLNGWNHVKNGKAALRAWGELRGRRANLRSLIMLGAGYEEGGQAHHWAVSHGLDQQVEFVGSVPAKEVTAVWNRSNAILIHPSRIEGQPLTLVEAMVTGVPIVADGNAGGVSWTLGNGDYGSLCSMADSCAVAREVLRIVDNDGMPERSKNARDWAVERFNIQTVADQYLSWFQDLR